MRVASRIALLTVLTLVFGARGARASVINVAEFNWTASAVDPGPGCDPADVNCLFLSTFTLTNIWDGSATGPTLTGSRLSLPDGDSLWFDLAPPSDPAGINIDQISTLGPLSAMAEATIFFAFGGQDYSLSTTLARGDLAALTDQSSDISTSKVLSFEIPDTPPAPVPEPGTLSLLAMGVAAGLTRARQDRSTPR